MRTTTILLALMLVLGLALWVGTAAAAAPEKWTGAPETAVMDEGRGGYGSVEEGRIVSAPEKFDLTHELAPASALTRGRVPCVPEGGRGGQLYRTDFGEKWVF